jgi:peptide/nickel transport system substrate-binding protein
MKNFVLHAVAALSLLTSAVFAGAEIVTKAECDGSAKSASSERLLTIHTGGGACGGSLVVAQRSELKTLNPLVALDGPSREVIGRMHSDLITVNRQTQTPEPALAETWKGSEDGRHYLVRLRQGLRFSDGVPFDSDDVVFSFKVYLDEKLHAPQRDQFIVGGSPVEVRKVDPHSVAFDFASSRAGAERLFDAVPMLPKHLLEKAYADGVLGSSWGLNTAPEQIAGMGPFRLKRYEPGQGITLERNPYYWKADQRKQRLPYLDAIRFTFAGSEDGQVARFLSHEADIINRIGSKSFNMLLRSEQARGARLEDLGPSLEYTFLTFNFANKAFQDVEFRRAVSTAIDRSAIARIAYGGRATVLAGNVTPANKLWRNENLRTPEPSIGDARKLLATAGYRWGADGKLLDRVGKPVRFSIVTGTNNAERLQTATLIQYDLSRIGIEVQVVPLEFGALVDRVTRTRQFEACILSFGGGDGDPNSEINVWPSSGSMHIWSPGQAHPGTAWEAEIDGLMRAQMSMLDARKRKQMYDRVQQIVAEQQPIICLVSPHILIAAQKKIVNFNPAVLESYGLWNADMLALAPPSGIAP